MKPTIKIAVVSKTVLMRQALIAILQAQEQFEVLFYASEKEQVIDQLEHKAPDIIIMSVEKSMWDVFEMSVVLKPFAHINLIALIGDTNDAFILHLLEQGVKAILTKDTTDDKLIDVIKEVHSKGFYYTKEIMRVIDRRLAWLSVPSNDYGITSREAEVMHLVCQGKSSREIAELLFISVKTVENHRYNLLKKIGTKNPVEIN